MISGLKVSDVCRVLKTEMIDIEDVTVSSIVYKENKVKKDGIFVIYNPNGIVDEEAIVRERIETAVSLGAAAICYTKQVDDYPCILVKSTRNAYVELGNYVRNGGSLFAIAVTGSAGKTTTKDMIFTCLSRSKKAVKTIANKNYINGVVSTILNVTEETEVVVLEMGMSHFNVISTSSRCANPNVAVITNIGHSHIGNLGSQDGVLCAKLEILDGMDENGHLLINNDDPILSSAKITKCKVITFGINNKKSDILAEAITPIDDGFQFEAVYKGNRYPVTLHCHGRHNIYNALATIGCGLLAGVSMDAILGGLGKFRTRGIRQNVYKKNGITVIADCYNAAPNSIETGLGILNDIKPEGNGRRIAVLADILELGRFSEELHRDVGRMVSESLTDILFCFGNDARLYAEKCGCQTMHFKTQGSLIEALKLNLRGGDVVLFKGSHGMALDKVLDAVLNIPYATTGQYGEAAFALVSAKDYLQKAVSAKNFMILDKNSGKIIAERNSSARIEPISLSKMMTCICVIENCSLANKIRINEIVLRSGIKPRGGGELGLMVGEELCIQDILTLTMLCADSVGINSLGEQLFGSIDAAVKYINEKAQQIGAMDSNFVNLHGVPEQSHYSTVADMMKITQYAMENSTFRGIVGERDFSLPPTNKCDHSRKFNNSNKLVDSATRYFYQHARGVKSTAWGGEYNLASAAELEGMELYLVSCGSKMVNKDIMSFVEAKCLFEFAFDNYDILRSASITL